MKWSKVLCAIWMLYTLINCSADVIREDGKLQENMASKLFSEPRSANDWNHFVSERENIVKKHRQGSLWSDNVSADEGSDLSAAMYKGKEQYKIWEGFHGSGTSCEPNSYLTRERKCMPCQVCKSDEVLTAPCMTFRDATCEKNETLAQCVDLFKRSHDKQFLVYYWKLTETRAVHHHFGKCFKYMADILIQIRKMTPEPVKNVQKRDAYSGDRNRQQMQDKDPNSNLNRKKNNTEEAATTTFRSDLHPFSGRAAHIPGQTNKNQADKSEASQGLETWVFIVIGIAAVIVIFVPLAVGLIIRKRRLAMQQERSSKKIILPNPSESDYSGPPATASVYDTQRSRSTDKGTERSRSTVSTYLSKDSQDAAGSYELAPLSAGYYNRGIKKSSVVEIFEESELGDQDMKRHHEYMPQFQRLTVERGTSRAAQHQLHHRDYARDNETDDDEASENLLYAERNMRQSRSRLRGGNTDFYETECLQSSKVHEPAVTKRMIATPSLDLEPNFLPSVCRPSWEQGRKESKSSSSTRSYISIPPTSPSENYIEAGSDSAFMPPEHSMPQFKMAWLTKNWKIDDKNEFSSYQSSSGTQTDGSSDVTAPNSKTVFGTPWQFGGTFTSRGGVMQAKDSDVCLVVVPNAVPKGEYVHIYGAIFTDTTEIRKKLIFSDKESLITPVVEYTAVPANAFRSQLCVQLPHALQEFDVSLIRVYTFTVDEQSKVSLHRVPMSNKTNAGRDSEVSWEKGPDGCSIHISTIHFSGYFCTLCDTSNRLPSICTMVFGSHVQITQSRREVRVIIYIWDRRLTIRDYLERFCKQELNVDRQLLTDMQIPLLDTASSDSRLVMCMEVMGEDDNRRLWRHILRSDGSRPLFKPLQVRKLSEIVYCCRQTDPIRVEWALENVPNQIPSTVFQCCIDVMHVHESTSDYVTAMKQGSDDLMRTFYVRDLKVTASSSQELKPSEESRHAALQRMLSESMDIEQTGRMCQEYGMTLRDIGNFRKKYSSAEEFQVGLIEECMKRQGFYDQLPSVLEKLHLTEVLMTLEDRKILVRKLTGFAEDTRQKIVASGKAEGHADDRESTRKKTPYGRSPSPGKRTKSRSPPALRKGKEDQRQSSRKSVHQQVSENDADDVVCEGAHHWRSYHPENHSSTDWEDGRRSRHSEKSGRHHSPLHDSSSNTVNRDSYVSSPNNGYTAGRFTHQNNDGQRVKTQKSSVSSDSVLGTRSEQSRNSASSYSPSSHVFGTSMYAHVDPSDYKDPYSDEFLDDHLKETYKKELMASPHMHGLPSADYTPYLNIRSDLQFSGSGPQAIPPESGQESSSSLSDPVPPYRKIVNNKRYRERAHSPDIDQTSKKELYDIHTLV